MLLPRELSVFHLTRFRLAPNELVTLFRRRDNGDTRVAARFRSIVSSVSQSVWRLLPWFPHLDLSEGPAKQKHYLLAREPWRSPA
jgi:hypothetical protein